MNKDLTEIIFVLDESGSMGSVRSDVIGGFNTFLKDQKEIPGDAVLTLVKFDTEYTKLEEGTLLENVKELDNERYSPNGMTALLDAVGKTINEVTSRHATLEEDERPAKTILVVFTDGGENSSTEFRDVKEVMKMVKEREEAGWEVLFMGADIDAWGTGSGMGFSKSRGVSKGDMLGNMAKMSYYTANYRSNVNVGATMDMADVNYTFDMSTEEAKKEIEKLKKK
jgi:hypothetical protein